jgi:hypothetical protein
MLRDVIQYPASFYYFAMVVNGLLRFFWVIGIFSASYSGSFMDYELLAFSSMLAEAVRRTMWALIRIENEFHNNFENYRSILVIPGLMDDVQ